MKTKIVILVLSLFLFSCSKEIENRNDDVIVNDTVTKNSEQKRNMVGDIQTYPSVKTCGIMTCALQEHLEAREKEGKFNLSKTEYYQSRFGSLATRFNQKDALLKSSEFQKFVKDFHTEFFAGTSPYTYDEKNFVWYIYLPRMINEEFARKRGGNDGDAESITQAIKERYYATYDEKEAIIQIYKDNLIEKSKNIDIASIDKKKLLEDKAYFEQIVLSPSSGIYDKIFQDITSIIWPERGQLRALTLFTAEVFFSKMGELGISKEFFYASIGTSEENFKKLNSKIESMNTLYGLSQKIPYDRYLRHDEIVSYIFTNLGEFNTKGDFNKDTLEMRHYILLQYSFPDENLYSMPERVSKFNSINNFMAEDLYKYSKSVNDVVTF